MYKYLLYALFTFGLLSCASSGVIVRDQPSTVSEIRKALTQVLGEPRSMSQNGREFLSKFHDRKQVPLDPDHKETEQLYTKVVVLGDRRPYDISVLVIVEKKEEGRFAEVDVDESLAEKIAESLQKQLNLSRSQDSNFIDDFRAF